jgi:hypothetical protein
MSGTNKCYPQSFNHHLDRFPSTALPLSVSWLSTGSLISDSGSCRCFDLLTWLENYEAHFVTALSFRIKMSLAWSMSAAWAQPVAFYVTVQSDKRLARPNYRLPGSACLPPQTAIGRNMAPPACHMQDPNKVEHGLELLFIYWWFNYRIRSGTKPVINNRMILMMPVTIVCVHNNWFACSKYG